MQNISFREYDISGITFDRFKEIATSLGFREATTILTVEDVLAGQPIEAVESANLLVEMLKKELSQVH